MNKKFSFIIFLFLLTISILLYKLNFPQPFELGSLVIGAILLIILINLPVVKNRLREFDILDTLSSRLKYTYGLLGIYLLIPIARTVPYPKLIYFLGSLLSIISFFSLLKDATKEQTSKGELTLFIIFDLLAICLHTTGFLRS